VSVAHTCNCMYFLLQQRQRISSSENRRKSKESAKKMSLADTLTFYKQNDTIQGILSRIDQLPINSSHDPPLCEHPDLTNGDTQMVPMLLVDEMTNALRNLYDVGVRKIVIMGIYPLFMLLCYCWSALVLLMFCV
uniref:Uncharacterized protein n=2 Tax=Chenopodium quinoa TaxID=63459 RepID=A0A803NA79_CHEQI